MITLPVTWKCAQRHSDPYPQCRSTQDTDTTIYLSGRSLLISKEGQYGVTNLRARCHHVITEAKYPASALRVHFIPFVYLEQEPIEV